MDIKAIRQDLAGELGAINQYQEHIESIKNENIRVVLEHIIADEKEHVAELTKLLRKFDKIQDEKFKKEQL